MRIQPRLNLLNTWRGVAAASYQDGKWVWRGRYQSNSVSDAQQLLCIMFPATEIPSFGLADPDRTEESVLTELSHFGGPVDIPVVMVRALHDYLDRYTKEGEVADFSGGSHFMSIGSEALTPEQRSLDVVESFATSLTLMLAAINFARNFRNAVSREELRADLDRLEQRARRRLTAAMVGLLRSFAVNTFDAGTSLGKALLRTANQANRPPRRVIFELREELRDVIAGLRDEITIGSGQGKARDLVSSNQLFECGWSWGVIHGTEAITLAEVGDQPEGVAADEPYLYFTVVALDAIAELFTERTRRASLLDEEQQRLARALQIRWDLTQRYWSVLADFGPGAWPLEDLPWRATNDFESDYLSVFVAGVAMRDLFERRADDLDLERLGQVLVELANRGRMTRRPMQDDVAIPVLHDPGFMLGLASVGDVGGPQLVWPIQDYAAALLKRTVRVASLVKSPQMHGQMLQLIDGLWDHILKRRMDDGHAKHLWDRPEQGFPSLTTEYDEPSWQMTVRVVESLVIAAQLVSADPLRSDRLSNHARDMLSEAERLLDQELLGGADEAGPAMQRTIQSITARLGRASRLLPERPGSATALISEVLLELDRLAAAREDSTWAR